jgi:phosphatidylserine/phosphatidylglycerophosphate/cardiolipin synthase-like enzyme
VFFTALAIALGGLSSILPVTSLATGAAVAVCFSPEEDCTALAVDAIDRAETQILVNAYGLTTSSKTVEALMQAKRRGIDVRVIADRTTPCERKSGLGSLAEDRPFKIHGHRQSGHADGIDELDRRRCTEFGKS